VHEQFVFGTDEPVIVQQTHLGEISLKLRSQRLQGVEKENTLKSFREGAKEIASRLENYRTSFNHILMRFLAHSRVFCMSETYANVVMWSHYAEQHSGAVIKLNCLDAIDDNFLMARRVTYTEKFPQFISVDDWVADKFGLKEIDYGRLAFNLAYIKHKDWSYEREWRIHIPLLPSYPAGNGMSLIEKHPSVFGALYLGCRMPIEIQDCLIEITSRKYPQMEIYRGSQSMHSFTLEFERII